ncbi:hypothetical protein [Streptomyces xanthophaeus]|uniref:hypothetical protein n=1 Tax=Streptomyces xanthophaeus TaxID=67385 RepID=UPI0026477249|nr:hypothetical protein [Streptomyces xanthophaeus]WKD36832.1 hypothetical protein KO717_36180 [Streptomyces xanthophaeus]
MQGLRELDVTAQFGHVSQLRQDQRDADVHPEPAVPVEPRAQPGLGGVQVVVPAGSQGQADLRELLGRPVRLLVRRPPGLLGEF